MRYFLLMLVLLCAVLGIPARPALAATLPNTSHTTVTPSTTDRVIVKAKSSGSWYIIRAAGLIAAVILILLILFGIGLITGLTYRILDPINAWAVHRALGIALGLCILVHIGALLIDKFQPYNIFQVIFPFLAPYSKVKIAGHSVGSLYIALGVFAMYCAAIVIISSLVWVNSRPKKWHVLHYISYLLVVLTFLHGLFTGTDLKHGLLRTLWLIGGVLILIGISLRLRRARTTNRDRV